VNRDRDVTAMAAITGWRVMRSDAGRWWATRERPFPLAVECAGAARTVDGDTEQEVCQAIAEQESLANQAADGHL